MLTNYIHLIEVLDWQDLSIIQTALLAEDIEFRTLSEHTLQIAGMYALGNRGAIIEVSERDYKKAKEVLLELGIHLDESVIGDSPSWLRRLDEITHKILWLGNLHLGYRLAVLVSLLTAIICTGVFLYGVRFSSADLSDHVWCVEGIFYEGQQVRPNTKNGVLFWSASKRCPEEIMFDKNGRVLLPGFDTEEVMGNWRPYSGKMITIDGTDGFKEIYEGEYKIEAKWSGKLHLISPKTTIKLIKTR